jgi:hypothetical protein
VVIEFGGHSTIRVVGLFGRSPDNPRTLARQFGCLVFETVVDGLIAIDIPDSVDIRPMYAALEEGQGTFWDLDIGVLSPQHEAQLAGDLPGR